MLDKVFEFSFRENERISRLKYVFYTQYSFERQFCTRIVYTTNTFGQILNFWALHNTSGIVCGKYELNLVLFFN